tara:strand:- start:57 stop:755 length:699 start_codon:yes stop_codon:yes gene_type:complete
MKTQLSVNVEKIEALHIAVATTQQYPRSPYDLGLGPVTMTRTTENSRAFRNAQTRDVSQVSFFSQITSSYKLPIESGGSWILINALIVASSALGALILKLDDLGKVALVTSVGAPVLTTITAVLAASGSQLDKSDDSDSDCLSVLLIYSALIPALMSVICPGPIGQLILHDEPDKDIKNIALVGASVVGSLVLVFAYALGRSIVSAAKNNNCLSSSPPTNNNESTLTPAFDY